jgi:hypothetical protein
MDDGFINKTDKELIAVWKDRKNPRYSKEYLDSVREELQVRGFFSGGMIPEDVEVMEAQSQMKLVREDRPIPGCLKILIDYVIVFFFLPVLLGYLLFQIDVDWRIPNINFLGRDIFSISADLMHALLFVLASIYYCGYFFVLLRDLKIKVPVLIFFILYLLIGIVTLFGGLFPLRAYFGSSWREWDWIFLFFATFLLTYITDFLVSKLAKKRE